MINFKLCVSCSTYNHEGYIKDAMEGFCMQRTQFPFVCVIFEDKSTDSTRSVIEQYIDENFEPAQCETPLDTDDYLLRFMLHRENRNCYFAVFFLKYNHYHVKDREIYSNEFKQDVSYTAICEGDDYWTDPTKLQQQVDFLDTHLEYTMCFHDVDIKAEKGREWYDVFGKMEDRDYTGLENMVTWSVPTCSMVMRREMFETRPTNAKFTMGDNVLILHCSRNGKIRCIPKKMGVYRLTLTSWIGGQSNRVQRYKYISHYLGLIEEFEECRCEQMYDILENQYFQLLTILKREGDKAEFERVKQEYLNYPGTTHWDRFPQYYKKAIARNTINMILGKKIVSLLRTLKYRL